MQNQNHLYINGQWVEPSEKDKIDIVNPATEAVIGRVPRGNHIDADAAIEAANRAFETWGQTTPSYRAALLKKIQAGLLARSIELAELIASEVGMPLKLTSAVQVAAPTVNFGYYGELAESYVWEETVGHSKVVREPIGVCVCITPWNFPLHQIVAKVGAALAAGCTVVLKPSEVAPLNAYLLAEVIHEAGVPPGVFNLVTGFGAEVGEALVKNRLVAAISFTGSTVAGRRISELAAGSIKRVSLELGGKSAAVILEGANFQAAVKSTVSSCFLNSGQACSAHTRMLVPQERYDEAATMAVLAAEKFTLGDPLGGTAKLGPLVSKAQQERVLQHISRAIADGATLLHGGTGQPDDLSKGYYVKPTVFGRVLPDSALGQEEVFGPVLSIMTYQDEEDAIRIANGTPYGLAGAVWASTDEKAEAVARRIRTGQIDINGAPFNPIAPFGGYKQSGNGREMGKFGLEEFLEVKAMQFRA